MDDPRQIRLFEASTSKVAPPEAGLYLGTSGWSYADWEGTLYPVGTPPGIRLAEYVKHFATVEIDSTFYGTPKRSTVERWREERIGGRVIRSPGWSRRQDRQAPKHIGGRLTIRLLHGAHAPTGTACS